MISVEEAERRICNAFSCLGAETVSIANATARVLAANITARLTQPPFDVSAMDGYALRAEDCLKNPTALKLIGEAPAGEPFSGKVQKGEVVRIFTGAVVPEGADTVVMQEDTEEEKGHVTVKTGVIKGKHIRKAGLDFREGEVLIEKGRRLSARDVSLLAAADIAEVSVTRKPRIAIVAMGNELTRPGNRKEPDDIIASSNYGLAALIEKWGGVAIDHAILPDRIEAFTKMVGELGDVDLLLTLGGASVGDYDLIQRALASLDFELEFWKVAMRPGKPMIFGRLKPCPVFGLPGNPVSAFVCALLFLRPAMAVLLGETYRLTTMKAKVAKPLKANDARQDYIRARFVSWGDLPIVEPLPVQDSSMQRALAEAQCLILRPPLASAAQQGEIVDAIPLLDC